MAYQTILVEIADHVALIRLNRPEALNAISGQLIGELATAVTAAPAFHSIEHHHLRLAIGSRYITMAERQDCS